MSARSAKLSATPTFAHSGCIDMLGCAVALILLMDVSASIGDADWQKQRDGTAEAFMHPTVQGTVEALEGGVAIQAMVFGGRAHVALPWRVARTGADLDAFAVDMKALKRQTEIATNTGRAVEAALDQMDNAPCEATKKVIDISTDGIDEKVTVEAARNKAQAKGITINAIGVGAYPDLETFLRDSTITEDGFAIISEGWDDFARAILRKIRMEIAAK